MAAALRMAALSLRHSRTALGAYYPDCPSHRRRCGGVYHSKEIGHPDLPSVEVGPYVDQGAETYEKRYQGARLKRLTAMAKDFGYQLTPNPAEV